MNDRMRVVVASVAILWGIAANGAEPVNCVSSAAIKSKSRQLNHLQPMMIHLITLEKQGEAEFHPKFPPPASECVLEKFDVAGTPVVAIYSPFEKGGLTLHYRFTAQSGEEAREILVVYDGLASLAYKKGDVFLVLENRKGNISYYEMFRDQPTYAALKPIVTAIIDGSAKQLLAVRWPPGAKEPVMDAGDMSRLK